MAVVIDQEIVLLLRFYTFSNNFQSKRIAQGDDCFADGDIVTILGILRMKE
jgi:hypothetical protein